MSNVCICCGKRIGLLNGSHLDNKLCDNCYFPIKEYLATMENELDANKIKENHALLNNKVNESPYLDDGKQFIIKYADELLNKQNIKSEAMIAEKHIRDNFKVTTGNYFEGYSIKDYKGLVSGNVILGTGFSSELDLKRISIAGDEGYVLSDKVNKARNDAISKMIDNAIKMDCNAIIGIKFNYFTFESNTIAVIVDGTAVNVVDQAVAL